MTYLWINPVSERMISAAALEKLLKKHDLTQVVCQESWGEIVLRKYRELLEHADGTFADARCPEAVSLVLQAGARAKGGEIFVLDMGKPVKILDLALNLIRLSGLKPYEDIDIVFTGLRPGEKLYEELLMDEEGLQSTDNELIHIGKPIDFDEELFIHQLEELDELSRMDSPKIKEKVMEVVPTYHMKENGKEA